MTRLIDTSLPPLVMLPGTLCDEFLFAKQIAALPAETHVGDITRSNSIEKLAIDVLENAPATFALAGLSLGGIVAAEVVRQAPERVVGLALLDTNLAASGVKDDAERNARAAEVRVGHFPTVVARDLVVPLTSDVETHGTSIFDMAMRVGAAAFLRQLEAAKHRPDRQHLLDELDIPVLIACGCLDAVTPTAHHEELVKRCLRGHLAVVPDAGHLSTIDQPAALTRVLGRWLQTCDNNLQEGPGHEYNFA